MITLQCKLISEKKHKKSLNIEPQFEKPVNKWKEQIEDRQYLNSKLEQTVKVSLAISILWKKLLKNLTHLKPLLVSEKCDAVVNLGLAPVFWDGKYGAGQIPPAGDCSHPKKGGIQIPQAQSVKI